MRTGRDGGAAGRLPRRQLAALLLLLAVAAVSCRPSPVEDENAYRERIARERAAKDAAFRSSESPIPPEKQGDFLPLSYYPVSLDYRVPAVLRVEADRPVMEMPTSTGQVRRMERVGTLEFSVRGQTASLGAFIEEGAPNLDRLFVPFTDLTSGMETYPAGRYLDLDRTATGLYIVDFNLAYNPYCYYNPAYDCPFPPRGNRLAMAVRAGERTKEGLALAPTRATGETE